MTAMELRRSWQSGAELHAPRLLRFEVVEVLREAELRGLLGPAAAAACLDALAALIITAWDFSPFARRVWDLRADVSAYDASYVALAEHLEAPLITLDERPARAPGIRCGVVVLGSR